MSWLVMTFAVLATWVMLTIVSNERRRLAEANAALTVHTAGPTGPAAAQSAAAAGH